MDETADGEPMRTPPACVPSGTAVPSDLARLAAVAADYAEASRAPATRRAYNSAWRAFATWCEANGLASGPAAPGTVALYLTARAEAGARVSTLNKAMAAIAAMHREAGFSPPAAPGLSVVWSGIRRDCARLPKKAAALVTADLRKVVARLPATPAGARDKALLMVGFAAALRRSELVAIWIGPDAGNRGAHQLEFVAGGMQIRMGRSKTDQEARGSVVAIPRGKTRLCPVAALQAWLTLSAITAGPVFRSVDRHGRIGPRLTDRAVADIVKRAVARAGLNPALFSGHSLRAGFVTSAAAAGVTTELIMRQTRHRDAKTVAGYVRDAELFTRNAAGKVGL